MDGTKGELISLELGWGLQRIQLLVDHAPSENWCRSPFFAKKHRRPLCLHHRERGALHRSGRRRGQDTLRGPCMTRLTKGGEAGSACQHRPCSPLPGRLGRIRTSAGCGRPGAIARAALARHSRGGPRERWRTRRRAGGCDNPPRKIPYYRLNQSTLVIKRY
jgi:hypothetical protein